MGFGGMGTWGVDCKSDPRWNKSGRAFGSVMAGGPKELQDWIDECKNKFGKPPDDCEQYFYKD